MIKFQITANFCCCFTLHYFFFEKAQVISLEVQFLDQKQIQTSDVSVSRILLIEWYGIILPERKIYKTMSILLGQFLVIDLWISAKTDIFEVDVWNHLSLSLIYLNFLYMFKNKNWLTTKFDSKVD